MGLLQDIFGQKPAVPTLTPIDFGDVQKGAAQQNIDVLPLAQSLATKTDTFNQAELNRLLAGAIPDIAQIQKNISGTLESETRGVLSPDVQAAVERSGVAKSLGKFGGSMAGEFVARDIGKTSYDISNAAMSSTERWLAASRDYLTPHPFNVASMFVTPKERLAQVTEERNLSFERQWLKNQIGAMPNPVAHGIWQAIDSYIHSYGGANSYAPTQYPQMSGGPGGASSSFYTQPSTDSFSGASTFSPEPSSYGGA